MKKQNNMGPGQSIRARSTARRAVGRRVLEMGLLRNRRSRQAGFTLTEVLIAMLVLAIGLLGLAALQAYGIRFNTDSYIRSQATNLAYDLMDRIRANRSELDTYLDEPDLTAFDGEVCNPTGVGALNDLACWYAMFDATLPEASPTILADAGDPNYIVLTLSWPDRDPRDFTGDDAPQVPRLPQSEDECLHADGDTAQPEIPNREWDGDLEQCLVIQSWTFYP